MKSKSTYFALMIGCAGSLYAATEIQSLDAMINSSVQGSPVTRWLDQSAQGNDALPSVGNVTFPSASLAVSGAAGLDFGTTRNSLELFSAGDSDLWLDQSAGTGGFCVLVAFKCDALITNNWNDLIGNSSMVSSGFGLRYSNAGVMQAYLNGSTINKDDAVLANGDTVIYGFNYDAAAESYDLWDSTSENTLSGTVAAADFSTGAGVTLGTTTFAGRYIKGMVGEVKIFNGALTPAEFTAATSGLVDKWINGIIPPASNQPPTVVFNQPTVNADLPAGSSLDVQVDAQDDGGIALVNLWMKEAADENFALVGASSTPVAPDTYEWNSSDYPVLANLQEGTYTVRAVALDNDPTNQLSRIVDTSFTVTFYEVPEFMPMSFLDWKTHYGLSGSETNLMANPDGDQYVNLVEFALGGNPKDAIDYDVIPPAITELDVLGTTYGEYTYFRRTNADALGLEYIVEHCSSLVEAWETNHVEEISATTNNAPFGFEEVIARVSVTNSTFFAHLKLKYTSISDGEIEIIVPSGSESDPVLFSKNELEAAIAEAPDQQGITSILISIQSTPVESKEGVGLLEVAALAEPAVAESYEIIRTGSEVQIVGADATGAMYGALEVAENLKLGLPVRSVTRTPFLKNRGIKFNIPLDARSPSYDDGGTAAQLNIHNMWDFEGFWKPYLDGLARSRYNLLSLWTRSPFPHLVDLRDEYPTINHASVDDGIRNHDNNEGVWRAREEVRRISEITGNTKTLPIIEYKTRGKIIVSTEDPEEPGKHEQGFLDYQDFAGVNDGWNDGGDTVLGDGFVDDVDDPDQPGDQRTVERIDGAHGGNMIPAFDTIDQKVAHWQQVFNYAESRGIKISFFFWNVFTCGATGHQGGEYPSTKITASQNNAATAAYLRVATRKLLQTYPQINAVGVIAGENDSEEPGEALTTEQFIYNGFGQGFKDVKEANPDRDLSFIWRNHSTKVADVNTAFSPILNDPALNANGPAVQASMKYSVGRLYSSRRPMEWERKAYAWLDDAYPFKVWMNIRNDDIFMHRWGSADYVRQYIRYMPRKDSPGFMMGSDGYVWGKEFIYTGTNEKLKNQLELEKHWFNFQLWGKLGYNNEIGTEYWVAELKHRFGLTTANAQKLHDAWQAVSEVCPQVVRNHWSSSDAGFAVEGCQFGNNSTTGFLTIPKFYYNGGEDFTGSDKNVTISLFNVPVKYNNNYGQLAIYKYLPMTLVNQFRYEGELPLPVPTSVLPQGGEQICISVPDWAADFHNNGGVITGDADMLTPFEVASNLDGFAAQFAAVKSDLYTELAGMTDVDVQAEFQELLWDIESMAELGGYYADKTRCAANYYLGLTYGWATYNAEYNQAKTDIAAAEQHWLNYGAILDHHYVRTSDNGTPDDDSDDTRAQVLSRTHYLDWYNTYNNKVLLGPPPIKSVGRETQAINLKYYKTDAQWKEEYPDIN